MKGLGRIGSGERQEKSLQKLAKHKVRKRTVEKNIALLLEKEEIWIPEAVTVTSRNYEKEDFHISNFGGYYQWSAKHYYALLYFLNGNEHIKHALFC